MDSNQACLPTMNSRRENSLRFTNDKCLILKWRDVDFNKSEKYIKSKIDMQLILTNHYFHAQNLTVKNGENNGVLAGVPFLFSLACLTRSRAPKFPLPLPLLTPTTQASTNMAAGNQQKHLFLSFNIQ